MKKSFRLCTALLSGLMVLSAATGCSCNKDPEDPKEPALPEARIDTCDANDYSVECSSIGADNFDDYAERSDVTYVDIREVSEYNTSHLQNFSLLPFNSLIRGNGTQLFTSDYLPRYADSVEILESILPKDKITFIMCQGGVRVNHLMKIMDMNGWDMSKVYNIGGMGQYGESKYKVLGFDVTELTEATTPVAETPSTSTEKFISSLPNARKDGKEANDYSATSSSIDASNFDDYAKMKDVVYVDLRNAEDYVPAHLHGFSMLEFFKSVWGDGNQLFKSDYTARYEESVEILEDILPKDKTIFLMCAGGSRVVHMMKIMEKYGWNMNNVYNVGGYKQFNEAQSQYIVSGYSAADAGAEITFQTGTDVHSFGGHTYTTTANVSLDAQNKIAFLYVNGECSSSELWGDADIWYEGKNEFIEGLIGKTLAEIQAMLAATANGATGDDVVTGATISSNRVLRAIVNALTPAA